MNDSGLSVTEKNRIIVEAFAELFYRQKNVRKAFLDFVSENYIQHNPSIPDGREAAIEMLEPKFSQPAASFNIKRILVDGDLAAIHLHGKMSADSPGGAVVDIFRLQNGKISEHWDVLQPMPTDAINPHPMF
jgi:predicted SnoaL-like aldol condensation-catalyzing enzyme